MSDMRIRSIGENELSKRVNCSTSFNMGGVTILRGNVKMHAKRTQISFFGIFVMKSSNVVLFVNHKHTYVNDKIVYQYPT